MDTADPRAAVVLITHDRREEVLATPGAPVAVVRATTRRWQPGGGGAEPGRPPPSVSPPRQGRPAGADCAQRAVVHVAAPSPDQRAPQDRVDGPRPALGPRLSQRPRGGGREWVSISPEAARRYFQEVQRVGKGIILLHDSSEHPGLQPNNRTGELTMLLVPMLQRGYRFVRLDEVPSVGNAVRGTRPSAAHCW